MSPRIIHICVREKFIPPFIALVHKNFNPTEHTFLISGKSEAYEISDAPGVIIIKNIAGRIKQNSALHSAEKIILHGLYDSKFLYIIALQPWLLKKCYWAIWGGDLYQFLTPRKSMKKHLKECIRAFIIRRMGHIITYIPGDYELARKWYGAQADRIECLMYESNVFSPPTPMPQNKRKIINVLLGNSAFPRNNHVEMLRILAALISSDFRVYVPLSYGPKEYAQNVAEEGRRLLGEKFTPIFEMMPKAEYLTFLDEIDIAIFNNTNQQAMGNIISLIGKGKTVFLRKSTTTWPLLESIGLKISDAEFFSLKLLTPCEQASNTRIAKQHFASTRLIQQLGSIFQASHENKISKLG